MIYTSRELINELRRHEDNFITVMLNDREYIIEAIKHMAAHEDGTGSYLCLKIRDGGDGYIKR